MSDAAVEDALYDPWTKRGFVGMDLGREPAPDETAACKFRHLLEQHGAGREDAGRSEHLSASAGMKLGTGTIVDATLIHAPSSTKNNSGARDADMQQAKKSNH